MLLLIKSHITNVIDIRNPYSLNILIDIFLVKFFRAFSIALFRLSLGVLHIINFLFGINLIKEIKFPTGQTFSFD